jgi:hypothetical protein
MKTTTVFGSCTLLTSSLETNGFDFEAWIEVSADAERHRGACGAEIRVGGLGWGLGDTSTGLARSERASSRLRRRQMPRERVRWMGILSGKQETRGWRRAGEIARGARVHRACHWNARYAWENDSIVRGQVHVFHRRKVRGAQPHADTEHRRLRGIAAGIKHTTNCGDFTPSGRTLARVEPRPQTKQG